jgi:hypothetical protein
MTYGELLIRLQQMSADELSQTATVCVDMDEYFAVKSVHGVLDSDVLDPGHYVLNIHSSF